MELSADAKATMVRLDLIRIWNSKKLDDDGVEPPGGGTDDRVFRLDRAPLEQCRSRVTDRQELAEMLRK